MIKPRPVDASGSCSERCAADGSASNVSPGSLSRRSSEGGAVTSSNGAFESSWMGSSSCCGLPAGRCSLRKSHSSCSAKAGWARMPIALERRTSADSMSPCSRKISAIRFTVAMNQVTSPALAFAIRSFRPF
jgi:hypothetical protein